MISFTCVNEWEKNQTSKPYCNLQADKLCTTHYASQSIKLKRNLHNSWYLISTIRTQIFPWTNQYINFEWIDCSMKNKEINLGTDFYQVWKIFLLYMLTNYTTHLSRMTRLESSTKAKNSTNLNTASARCTSEVSGLWQVIQVCFQPTHKEA